MSIEDTSKSRHRTISMSRSAIPPNTSSPSSSDERRQELQPRYSQFAIRANMHDVVDIQIEGVDAMNACDRHVSCRHYTGLRPNRNAGTTEQLSARMPRDLASTKRQQESQPLMANRTPQLWQQSIICSPPIHIATGITKMSHGKRALLNSDPAGYDAVARYNDCVACQMDRLAKSRSTKRWA